MDLVGIARGDVVARSERLEGPPLAGGGITRRKFEPMSMDPNLSFTRAPPKDVEAPRQRIDVAVSSPLLLL